MRKVSPYLKMRVLGAIEFASGNSIRDRIKSVSAMSFTDDDGVPRFFTWRTIETWSSRYKKDGVTSMKANPRSDKGCTRKVEPERLLEAVEQVLPCFHNKSISKAAVYRKCIEKGILRREEIAPNTFSRLVETFELLKPDGQAQNKRRLAFSKAHANQMWQADTMFGPYVQNASGKSQSYLIAFMDDASRVICHAEFFLAENTAALIKALRSALYKRGVPEAIYVDNGSVYVSKEITQICARLGTLLCHTPIRDGAAKGKIERFFRTVRGQFLIRNLDLSSVENLNRDFRLWVEDEYNSRVHSTIGMKPIDRFGLDLNRIRFLPPHEASDEFFFVEEDRRVANDNTFSFKNTRFEAPRDLRTRKIQVRFDRHNPSRIVVYYKAERMGEAKPLDRLANDRKPSAAK